jgi:hypothetical protein
MGDHYDQAARQLLVESLAQGNGSEPNLLAGLRHGAWLDGQEIAPLEYHVPGVIPEGSTLLVGPPKIGKSWLLLALALAEADGGMVLGLSVKRRPVLYLALEDGDRRLQARCRTLLAGSPIPSGLEYTTRITPGTVLGTVQTWLETLPADAKPLVIVDTLGKVMPPAIIGESSYQRDYRVGSALKALIDDRPGSALVVAHHDRKAGADDFVDAVSGTHGLAGAADTIIVLVRARTEGSGLLKVTGRDVDEAEYAVEFKGGSTWELAGHSLTAALAQAATVRATAGVGDTMARVVGFVAAHAQGVRAPEVAAGLGLDRHSARTYLARAADSDRLVRLGRGLYGPPSTPVASVASVAFPGSDDQEVQHMQRSQQAQLGLLAGTFGDDIEVSDP